jgi:hypothetical protein
MSNLNNFNFNKLDLRLSNSDYWDFFIANNEDFGAGGAGGMGQGTCYVVHYDFNDIATFNSAATINTIYSLVTWDKAINTGYTLDNIGFTGLDNGLLTYVKQSGDTFNTGLTHIITGSTVVIPSGDTRLILNRVTGSTGNYIYPIYKDTSSVGDSVRFCGGFYQGYFKLDGYDYQVLPTRVNQAWVADFWLNKTSGCTTTTGTTLNDIYPNNKGFFFYMGTRAENKYWNVFEGLNTGCTLQTSACTGTTKFFTLEKETDISIIGDYGISYPLSPPSIDVKFITNQFLIYGRADGKGICNTCGKSDGLARETICSFTGGTIITSSPHRISSKNKTNPFLIYGRADGRGICNTCAKSDGYGRETICSYSGNSYEEFELDRDADIVDNALGFRIKDDGSIGYRLLKVLSGCTGNTFYTGVTVEEQYSDAGLIKDGEWTRVTIRYVANEYYSDTDLHCKPKRQGRLMFYVDCKLKKVFENVDELVARRLHEYKDKQLGVPFNFSLGGGSQGLIESMTFDGQDSADLGLKIEQHFAGSFIGLISDFKFYICDLNFNDINSTCGSDAAKYGVSNIPEVYFLIDEFGNYIITEDGYPININN